MKDSVYLGEITVEAAKMQPALVGNFLKFTGRGPFLFF